MNDHSPDPYEPSLEPRFDRMINAALAAGDLGFVEWDVASGSVTQCARVPAVLGARLYDDPPTIGAFVELFHDEDRDALSAFLAARLGDGEDARHECRAPDAGETDRWVAITVAPPRSSPSGEGCRIAFLRDITRQRAAAAALRTQDDRLRATIETSPDVAVQWYDRVGRVIFWNGASERLFGFTAQEALGKTLDQLIHTAEETAAFHEALAQVEATRVPVGPDEHSFRRRDGSRGMCRSTLFMLPSLGDDATFVCMDIDVTEKTRAEEALRETAARHRALVENAFEAIALVGPEGRYVYCSPAMRAMFGWPLESCAGRHFKDDIDPSDRARVARIFDDVAAAPGVVKSGEVQFRQIKGQLRWMEYRAVNMLGDPAIRSIVMHVRDITEKRGLEERLRQGQKLESIGRLAGGVAHDFNNLLTVVFGYLDLSLSRPSLDPELNDYLSQIGDAARRGERLTQQLLAFARRQVIEPRVVEPCELIGRSEPLLRRLIGEHIRLEVKCNRNVGRIRVDPGQFDQVLMNLALNARDAMPSGGTLTVALGSGVLPAAAAEGAPAEAVVLEVRDTGVGMDQTTIEHIFEPFFTTKEVGRGTGLGLATVFGIVKQNGGHIDVETQKEKGTTIRVYWTRDQGTGEDAAQATRALPTRRGQERVLVVEDDSNVRRIVAATLTAAGYRVTAPEDPRDAPGLVIDSRLPFDLVVTDVVMPGIDGRELAEQVRRARPGIRVLLTSGYAETPPSALAEVLLRTPFLRKPFSPTVLLSKVREVLDLPLPNADRRQG